MERSIHVKGQQKGEPNYHLYVLALIALARQLQEEDKRQAAPSARNPDNETRTEGSE